MVTSVNFLIELSFFLRKVTQIKSESLSGLTNPLTVTGINCSVFSWCCGHIACISYSHIEVFVVERYTELFTLRSLYS